jgi:hypothetical protein
MLSEVALLRLPSFATAIRVTLSMIDEEAAYHSVSSGGRTLSQLCLDCVNTTFCQADDGVQPMLAHSDHIHSPIPSRAIRSTPILRAPNESCASPARRERPEPPYWTSMVFQLKLDRSKMGEVHGY